MSWFTPPTEEQMVSMYREMLRIRLFEQEILKREQEGLSIHSCAGHEAVALGIISQLSKQDLVVSNHRPWAHFLAKGGTLKESVAELYGKETGVCKGMGGEMHLCKPEVGFIQSMMIVGANLTFACGVALSTKRSSERIIVGYEPAQSMDLNNGRVFTYNKAVWGTKDAPAKITVCFFGEATSTNGAFNEALTMAKTLELPILFVCENNGVNGNTPASEYMPTELVTHRASGYGFPTNVCDGSDVLAVWEAGQKAINYVRDNRSPYFLECRVARINRHKVPRMTDVRPPEIKRVARMRDPIPKLKNALYAEGLLDEERDIKIIFELQAEIKEAVEFAKR